MTRPLRVHVGIVTVLAGALAIAFAGGLTAIARANGVVGVLADDAVYLMMADCIRALWHANPTPPWFVWEFTQFPPLYPTLMALAGGGSAGLVAAHTVTALATVAGAAMLAWAARREGLPAAAALLLAAAWLALPRTVLLSVEAMSEAPFVAFTLAALALAGRGEDAKRSWLVPVLVGCALLTRSAGVALVVAHAVWSMRHARGAMRWAWLIAATPGALWIVVKWMLNADRVYYVSDIAARYAEASVAAALHHVFVDGGYWLWAAWLRQFDITGSAAVAPLAALVLAMALPCWALRLRDWRLDALYVLGYLVLIMVWPYHRLMERFAWPLTPVLLAYAAATAGAVARRATHVRPALIGCAAALTVFAMVGPSWIQFGARLRADLPARLAHVRGSSEWLEPRSAVAALRDAEGRELVYASMRASAEVMPPGGCAFSVQAENFMYNARRVAFVPPFPDVAQEAFAARLVRCEFVHVLHVGGHPSFPPGYPLARLAHYERLHHVTGTFDRGTVEVAELVGLAR